MYIMRKNYNKFDRRKLTRTWVESTSEDEVVELKKGIQFVVEGVKR